MGLFAVSIIVLFLALLIARIMITPLTTALKVSNRLAERYLIVEVEGFNQG